MREVTSLIQPIILQCRKMITVLEPLLSEGIQTIARPAGMFGNGCITAEQSCETSNI